MTRGEIIRYIIKFGTPVVMASDVSIAPRSVEKVATKLGCVVYSPDASLSINEKTGLSKEYYSLMKNDHEVDALSAAIKAWKHYRTLFSRVNEVLKRFDRLEIFSEIVQKMLKEKSPNIEDAIREFIEKERPPAVTEKVSKEENIRRDLIGGLQKNLTEKQQHIESLKSQNILLNRALNEIKNELNKLKERKLTIERTEDYIDLRNSIEYVKKLRKLENKGYYPVIEIEKVHLDLIEQMNDKIDLDSRVILVEGKENLNLLNDRNIKCLITLEELDISDIKNLEFPVVQIDEEELESFDDIKAIKIDYIEKRLADAKKLGLVGWLKGYRSRRD